MVFLQLNLILICLLFYHLDFGLWHILRSFSALSSLATVHKILTVLKRVLEIPVLWRPGAGLRFSNFFRGHSPRIIEKCTKKHSLPLRIGSLSEATLAHPGSSPQ